MKNKKVIAIVVSMIALISVAAIISVMEFGVINPFSSCFGMLEILFTDKEYTVVQNYPNKVIFSKTGETLSKSADKMLDEYMQSRGFTEIPEEQMGGVLVYSNGIEKEHISFSGNKYYSKWIWSN